MENADVRVKAAGYELRLRKIRPSVWSFGTGGSGLTYYQCEQEELHHVFSGVSELAFAGDDGEETEALDLEPGGSVVVSPDEVRQLRCVEVGGMFVIGAPNAKDDGIVVG